MPEQTLKDAVLMVADVTASVALYERLGDARAFETIASMLDRLRRTAERAGGAFVQWRGDDVLCVFTSADAAAAAAAAMLDLAAQGEVTLHVAMHAGEAIAARDSIFGDAVNVTYRLASVANANEALASSAAFGLMSPVWQRKYRPLLSFRFKGKADPIEVFGFSEEGELPMTRLPGHLQPAVPDERIVLRLGYRGRVWDVQEAESLHVGRAEGADVRIPRPWVSRRHAVLHVRDGLAMLTDRSSFGSFLMQDGAIEMRVRRTSVTLSGSGTITLGTSHRQPQAECIEFDVQRAPIGGSPSAG